jgi:hypothetical protein
MIALPVVAKDRSPNTTTIHHLDWYDYCLVSFSGGKDSIALALGLLQRGGTRERILLMHQHVDGEPGVDRPFMDWPCTEGYCRAFAQAMGLRLLFQWRHGGTGGGAPAGKAPAHHPGMGSRPWLRAAYTSEPVVSATGSIRVLGRGAFPI